MRRRDGCCQETDGRTSGRQVGEMGSGTVDGEGVLEGSSVSDGIRGQKAPNYESKMSDV